jgi:hypothetical protein
MPEDTSSPAPNPAQRREFLSNVEAVAGHDSLWDIVQLSLSARSNVPVNIDVFRDESLIGAYLLLLRRSGVWNQLLPKHQLTLCALACLIRADRFTDLRNPWVEAERSDLVGLGVMKSSAHEGIAELQAVHLLRRVVVQRDGTAVRAWELLKANPQTRIGKRKIVTTYASGKKKTRLVIFLENPIPGDVVASDAPIEDLDDEEDEDGDEEAQGAPRGQCAPRGPDEQGAPRGQCAPGAQSAPRGPEVDGPPRGQCAPGGPSTKDLGASDGPRGGPEGAPGAQSPRGAPDLSVSAGAPIASSSSSSSSSQEEDGRGGGTNASEGGLDPFVLEYLHKLEIWPGIAKKLAADSRITRRFVMAVWQVTEPNRKAGERIGALSRSIIENGWITEHDLLKADEALARMNGASTPTPAPNAEAGWDDSHRDNVARLRPLGLDGVKQLAIRFNLDFRHLTEKTGWMQANWQRFEERPEVAAALATTLDRQQGVTRG